MWKTIRVDGDVYQQISIEGKFGETANDVLRRILQLKEAAPPKERRRLSARRMSSKVENGALVVGFAEGPSSRFALPQKHDKSAIRSAMEQAIRFANANGASEGQERAIRKVLTDAGYYLTR